MPRPGFDAMNSSTSLSPCTPLASPSPAFSNNLQKTFVAIDCLKTLVEQLGENYELDISGERARVASEPISPSHPRVSFPKSLPTAPSLPDTDTIDVVDHDEHLSIDLKNDDQVLNIDLKGDDQVDERLRIKIRDLWKTEDDFKVSQSLASAQKKIRSSGLKKNTGGLLLTNSFLGLNNDHGYMMHPQCRPRLCWSCFSLLFVLYDVFMIPLQTFKPPDSMSPWSLSLIIVLFWTIDICMSFRTGVFREGLLIMDPRLVAKEYAFTWLLPDIMVVIVEWVALVTEASRGFALTRGLRLVRFIRLFRVAKLRALLGAIEHRLPAGTFHLFLYNIKLIAILIMLVHFLACAWYGLGEIDADKGWTTIENVGGEDVSYRYFLSARWTLAQMNGRTDLEKRTMIEYAFTCSVIVSAFVLVSLFISGITNAMIQINTVAGERRKAKELLQKFLDQRGVSAELAMDVKMCHLQRSSRNVTDELKIQSVLKQLPKPMLFQLLQEVFAPRLRSHDLLQKLSTGYPMPFRHLCAEAVHNVQAHPDEIIFNAGEACSRMLIVDSGSMIYHMGMWQSGKGSQTSNSLEASATSLSLTNDGREQLVKGQWVAEAALWAFWETRGQLEATSPCNLLSLEANDVARVLDLYKDAHALVSFYAVLYVEAIHDGTALSDVVETCVASDLTKRVVNENVSDLVAHVTLRRGHS